MQSIGWDGDSWCPRNNGSYFVCNAMFGSMYEMELLHRSVATWHPPPFYEPANEQKDNGNMRHRVLINTHYPNICCQDIFIWEHCYLFSPVYQINHVLFLGDLYWAVVRTLFARKINLSRQSLGGIGFAATTEDCIIRSGGQFVLPLGWLINKRVLIALKTAYRKVSVHDNRQTLTFLPYWLPFV